jgi:hypothetical protein
MDPSYPAAKWIAVRGDRILTRGGDEDLKDLKDRRTRIIECTNRTIVPGFNDAHSHLHALAESFHTLDLGPRGRISSIYDIQDKIRQLSPDLPPGTWIRGGGYNEFHLREKRHPTRWDLDKATSLHPLKLTHRSGHAHVLNSLALQLAEILKETPDPPGGLIDRDLETGEPTGILYGMGDRLSQVVPPLEDQQIEEGIKKANRELLSLGITSIQDASARNDLGRWQMFQRWKGTELLKPRVTMMLGVEGFQKNPRHDFSTPLDKNQLRLGGVKIFLDETTGQLAPSQEELNQLLLDIHPLGVQVALHAFEETTIAAACAAIESSLRRFPRDDHRHRIEHCAVCPPALSRRLASLGIIVVTQPSFIFYHGDRYLETVPKGQLKHLYPFATLIRNGVRVAGSSDCPIVPSNPLIGIYSAVSREAETGALVSPEERITPLEALRMYTDYAARANFEEASKGSITPGKLADLVVLNGDPTKVSAGEIKDIKVEMTIINGKVVWGEFANQ